MGTTITVSTILVVWALVLIFRDRHDWKKYAIVILASLYIGPTSAGSTVRDTLNSLVQGGSGFITQLFNGG